MASHFRDVVAKARAQHRERVRAAMTERQEAADRRKRGVEAGRAWLQRVAFPLLADAARALSEDGAALETAARLEVSGAKDWPSIQFECQNDLLKNLVYTVSCDGETVRLVCRGDPAAGGSSLVSDPNAAAMIRKALEDCINGYYEGLGMHL